MQLPKGLPVPDTPRSITTAELEAALGEAATRGAKEALRQVGLNDDNAQNDLRDLRALLSSWKEVRKGVLQAVVKVLTTALLGALLLGLGVKIGAGKLLG